MAFPTLTATGCKRRSLRRAGDCLANFELIAILVSVIVATLITAGGAQAADSDGDGIDDDQDNCIDMVNAAQRDTDADNIGNRCDADIAPPNDCLVNFPDLDVIKLAFFSTPAASNWNSDADLNGDGVVGFSDLQVVKASFFGEPGPSGLPNLCMPLGKGEVCDPDANFCGADLACCYPCGIPGCEHVCVVPCDPDSPSCTDGCLAAP